MLLGSFLLLGGGEAKAEEAAKPGVITLREITITGRIQKPLASVELQRLQPKLSLSEHAPSFLGRIGAAIHREPF